MVIWRKERKGKGVYLREERCSRFAIFKKSLMKLLTRLLFRKKIKWPGAEILLSDRQLYHWLRYLCHTNSHQHIAALAALFLEGLVKPIGHVYSITILQLVMTH